MSQSLRDVEFSSAWAWEKGKVERSVDEVFGDRRGRKGADLLGINPGDVHRIPM